MRAPAKSGGVTINAVAGTRVVFLGLDLTASKRDGCLGFAIQRHDSVTGETMWLRGKKTFAATDPGVGPGGNVPTLYHPVQGFWWADYDVAPGRTYTYTVVPRYGTPAALTSGASASTTVTTEVEDDTHSIFFNRGAVASQEYAHDFDNRPPKKLSGDLQQAAYRYLSHGLHEALLAFIARAKDGDWSLHGAVYEFNWPDVLNALGAARGRGAEVKIVYDAIPGKRAPVSFTRPAIKEAGIADLCIPRSTGKIMHNKFFVLSRKGKPVAVWTGSTNISENGIFGHLNVGHSVEDATIAHAYMDDWTDLSGNPSTKATKDWVMANDDPDKPWTAPVTTVFSPHRGDAVLGRYATIAGSAKQALCMTLAFGMNDLFKEVYGRGDGTLRMALMEDYGSGRSKKVDTGKIKALQRASNVVISIGNHVPINGFDEWVAESSGLTANVQWVHTKFMLVDPLSKTPTVITGSANFSPDSVDTNDENMLVIQGNQRVADIYFTEYMRLFAHYGFREAVAIAIAKHEPWHPGHLKETWQEWGPPFFDQNDDRNTRRRYFATGKVH
jgi:phosphatidylserine/phosphatidylglycerophosphate/cardiolipin synthase-like enzyme